MSLVGRMQGRRRRRRRGHRRGPFLVPCAAGLLLRSGKVLHPSPFFLPSFPSFLHLFVHLPPSCYRPWRRRGRLRSVIGSCQRWNPVDENVNVSGTYVVVSRNLPEPNCRNLIFVSPHPFFTFFRSPFFSHPILLLLFPSFFLLSSHPFVLFLKPIFLSPHPFFTLY